MKKIQTKNATQLSQRSAEKSNDWWGNLKTRERNICRYAAVSFITLLTVGGTTMWLALALVVNLANAVRLLRHVELPQG
jgi:cell division septal protein FtsQ